MRSGKGEAGNCRTAGLGSLSNVHSLGESEKGLETETVWLQRRTEEQIMTEICKYTLLSSEY